MKFILPLFLVLFVSTSYAQDADANTLKITITNIKQVKGNMMVGVFSEPNGFLEKNKAFKNVAQKVTGNTAVIVLNNLKKGDYAIALYQDVNSDNKCNMNFLGIPVEPYGFSQNFKPKFSKPKFDDCKVLVNENKSINIKLID